METLLASKLAGARILVVEDEFYLANDLADALRAQGAEVIGPAPTAEMAEQLIAHDRPDCAILDLNLRGSRSVALAEALDRQGIRYLVLSGYDASAIPPSCAGAPYLEKPATSDAVTEAVSKLIGAR